MAAVSLYSGVVQKGMIFENTSISNPALTIAQSQSIGAPPPGGGSRVKVLYLLNAYINI